MLQELSPITISVHMSTAIWQSKTLLLLIYHFQSEWAHHANANFLYIIDSFPDKLNSRQLFNRNSLNFQFSSLLHFSFHNWDSPIWKESVHVNKGKGHSYYSLISLLILYRQMEIAKLIEILREDSYIFNMLTRNSKLCPNSSHLSAIENFPPPHFTIPYSEFRQKNLQ
jgi:hypothetical protein